MGLSGLPTLVSQVIEIDRLSVNCARAGSGTPLVLLPGWGAEIASFGLIPSILAERFQVTAATVDEISCRFVAKGGRKYEIHANITVRPLRPANSKAPPLGGDPHPSN